MEMGLGETTQTICFICAFQAAQKSGSRLDDVKNQQMYVCNHCKTGINSACQY